MEYGRQTHRTPPGHYRGRGRGSFSGRGVAQSPANTAEVLRQNLRLTIARLGDRSEKAEQPQLPLEEELPKAATELRRSFPEHIDYVVSMLVECAASLPTKAPLYGTLTALVWSESADFAPAVVSALRKELTAAVAEGRRARAKLLLRFTAALSNSRVVARADVARLLRGLVQGASELAALGKHARADFLATAALWAVPWLEDREDVPTITAAASEYASGRAKAPTAPLASPWDGVEASVDIVDAICGVGGSAPTQCAQRPHRSLGTSLEGLPTALELEMIELPAAADAPEMEAPVQRVSLRLFRAGELLGELDRAVVEDYVCDALETFRDSSRRCALQLAGVPAPQELRSAASRAVVEAVLGRVLEPAATSPQPPLFYCSLLAKLGVLDPAINTVVISATNAVLRDRLPAADVECRDRFCTWYADYLSQFNCMWSWKLWTELVAPERADGDVYAQFLRDVLERLCVSCAPDTVRTALPEALHSMMPAAGSTGKAPFEGDEDSQLQKLAEVFANALVAHVTAEEAKEWVERQNQRGAINERRIVEFVTRCVLQAGRKSASHLDHFLAMYSTLFEQYADAPAQRAAVLEHAESFFLGNPSQSFGVAVDRLLLHGVVMPPDVVGYVLDERRAAALAGSRRWEIVRDAIAAAAQGQGQQDAVLHALTKAVALASDAEAVQQHGAFWKRTVVGHVVAMLRQHRSAILPLPVELAEAIKALDASAATLVE